MWGPGARADRPSESHPHSLAVEWRYAGHSTEDTRHAQSQTIPTTVAFLGQRRGPGLG